MGMFDIVGQEGLDTTGGQAYYVDIAMLIDATGSMAPIIGEVKNNALAFCTKFHEAMKANGKNVEELRIKVIPFRDFECDGDQSLDDSGFFVLPQQNEEFRRYVDDISAKGGGDEPESALEAIAAAMRSDWTKKGGKRRHVILVFTDASAVPLQEPSRTANPSYPADMPRDLAQLGDMWCSADQETDGMPDPNYARMVLFAPNVQPWCDMQVWNNVWTSFSMAGTGLQEVDIDMAIQLLVNSVN